MPRARTSTAPLFTGLRAETFDGIVVTLHAGDVVRVHYNLDEEPRHALDPDGLGLYLDTVVDVFLAHDAEPAVVLRRTTTWAPIAEVTVAALGDVLNGMEVVELTGSIPPGGATRELRPAGSPPRSWFAAAVDRDAVAMSAGPVAKAVRP